MSSNEHANTLLAALSEVERNPSLGFTESFTVFSQHPPSPAVSSNLTATSTSSGSQEVEVLSPIQSASLRPTGTDVPLVESGQHRNPQFYERKDSKAIPKKGPTPANQSLIGSSQSPWNGLQTEKNEVKLGILKAAGDSHTSATCSVLEKAGWSRTPMQSTPHRGGRGKGRGRGRGWGRGNGDHDNQARGRGRGLRGNATGLHMAGRQQPQKQQQQQQTTPSTTAQMSLHSRNWRFANRLPCGTSDTQWSTQDHTVSILTIPHSAASMGNFATHLPHTTSVSNSNSNIMASSCPNASSGSNNPVSSTLTPVATSSAPMATTLTVEANTSNIEAGESNIGAVSKESEKEATSSALMATTLTVEAIASNIEAGESNIGAVSKENEKEENSTSSAAGSSEKGESSKTSDLCDSSNPPQEQQELQESLCSNCGAWSIGDRFCSFCNCDFSFKKPKKTRPKSDPFTPSMRPTYRKPEKRTTISYREYMSKTSTAKAATSQTTSLLSNSQNATSSANDQSKLVSVKSLASVPGISVKPHPTNKQRFIVTKSLEPKAPPTDPKSPNIDAKTFYVNKLAAVSSSPTASTGGISTTTPDGINNKMPNSRKRTLKSGGGRKTPAKRAPPKRKEPEIVLISDSEDEEDNTKEQKMNTEPASEEATESDEELARSFMTVKAKMRDQEGNLMGRPNDHGGTDSTDGSKTFTYDSSRLHVAFNVAILRFGSWPMHTFGTTLKLPAVSMTPDGFQFHFQQSTHKCGKIELLLKDIEKCDHYISDDGFSTFFITTTPCFASIVRSRLNMSRKDAHFDPGSREEYEKMVVIRSTEERSIHTYKESVQRVLAAMVVKSSNTGSGLKFEPIDNTRTSILLNSSTRPEMKGTIFITKPNNCAQASTINFSDRPASISMQNLSIMRAGGTPSKTKSTSDDPPDNKLFVYPPPPKFGGITVTTEDRDCLEEGEFLNDVIIDFYLKYIVMEKLSDVDRERTHLFSCFFYKRLMQQDSRGNISPDLNGLTPKEKRHQKVRKWTRHVDIFAKDFIIIPINDCAHWFVAIICFAGEVIHMKKGTGKLSQSPSPVSSNQPSPASASSPATPSPATPSRATPSPSEQLANHALPGVHSTKAADHSANQRLPGVQVSSSLPQQGAELLSKSPPEKTTQTVPGNSESANRTHGAEHVCQQPVNQGCENTNEEEPMDTSESAKEESKGSETERTTNIENNASDNLLNKSIGNSTGPLHASNNTAASEKVPSESAISSGQSSPRSGVSPATVQNPAVNGRAPKQKLLDFDYQQYHVGQHKEFKQPSILVFDSLAGPPRRNVIAKLRDYLTIEWEKRKGGKCEFTTANMKGMNPKVPQQNNFSDCGLYVCQYVETFFAKPIRNYHSPMRGLQNWFPEEIVAKKRQEIRTAIKELKEAYKARR